LEEETRLLKLCNKKQKASADLTTDTTLLFHRLCCRAIATARGGPCTDVRTLMSFSKLQLSLQSLQKSGNCDAHASRLGLIANCDELSELREASHSLLGNC